MEFIKESVNVNFEKLQDIVKIDTSELFLDMLLENDFLLINLEDHTIKKHPLAQYEGIDKENCYLVRKSEKKYNGSSLSKFMYESKDGKYHNFTVQCIDDIKKSTQKAILISVNKMGQDRTYTTGPTYDFISDEKENFDYIISVLEKITGIEYMIINVAIPEFKYIVEKF